MSENNLIYYNALDYEVNNVSWVIDRTPDYALIDNRFTEVRQQIMNRTVDFNVYDDFIPFETPYHEPIKSVIQEIHINEEEKLCCICYETKEIKDISQINCNHKFCGSCIIQYISKKYNDSCCPLCREKIKHIIFQQQSYQDEFLKII